jgi:hypothetical protein
MEDRDVEELHRIWGLKEKGAISEEEYAQLKGRILKSNAQPESRDGSETATPNFVASAPISRNQPAKGPTSRQAVGIGCAVVFLLLVIAGLASSNSDPKSLTNTNNTTAAADENLIAADMNVTAESPPQSADEASSPWSYSEDEDKVRGGTTYYARTTSTNSIAQSFPYDSDTTMSLLVRKSPAYGTDVILTISSGQMMCPSYDGCSGTVRFDSGPAERVSFNGPADNSSDTVFVVGPKQFIAKLKKAKKVTIEKTLYEAGNPQFEFDVQGLKWNH